MNFVDIDECQSPDACGSVHVCNNTVGSYACECPLGFVADSGPQNPLEPICVGKYVVSFSQGGLIEELLTFTVDFTAMSDPGSSNMIGMA